MGVACPHNSGAMGAVPPQLFIGLGTVGAVVPKLGVVGHKGKIHERKHFSEKSPSFIGSAAHLADKPLLEAATKVLSSLSWEGIPHLFANAYVFFFSFDFLFVEKTKG